MSIRDVLTGTPGVALAPVLDPLEFGYRPVGLPRLWRRTEADLIAGQPAAAWLDSIAVEDAPRYGRMADDADSFASSAIVMAWTIAGMPNSPARLATLVTEVTESTTGWSPRNRSAESLPGQGFSIHMLGSLDSPFGPLVSNVHNVVCPIGNGATIVVGLVVTAATEWTASADRIVLERISSS